MNSNSLSINGLDSGDYWDFENGYHFFSDSSRFGKILSQYELLKKVLDVPGDFVELGVYKGCSAIRLATFRELLETQLKRKIYLFDAFGAFPRENSSLANDLKYVDRFEMQGGDGLSVDDIQRIFQFKNMHNIECIKGDVFDTIPAFLRNNKQIRFSYVHLDLDVYEPTKLCLDLLWPHVSPGGIIVFDDYNGFEGATLAIEEFLALHPSLSIQLGSYTKSPSYIRKTI